jgi:hypothetical protein
MRITLAAAALALAGLTIAGPPAAAQADQDGSFNLTNRSGRAIERLYASPQRSRNWGENRLSPRGLANGGDVAVRMPPAGGCRTDLRLVYEGGLTEEKRDIDTCQDRDVVVGTPSRTGTLQRDSAGKPVTPRGDPSFELVNDGTRQIREFFASPTSSDDWGEDRLGQDVVEPGDRLAIRLPNGPCQYDLRAVWSNGRSDERRDVNLCETSEVSFK